MYKYTKRIYAKVFTKALAEAFVEEHKQHKQAKTRKTYIKTKTQNIVPILTKKKEKKRIIIQS